MRQKEDKEEQIKVKKLYKEEWLTNEVQPSKVK